MMELFATKADGDYWVLVKQQNEVTGNYIYHWRPVRERDGLHFIKFDGKLINVDRYISNYEIRLDDLRFKAYKEREKEYLNRLGINV